MGSREEILGRIKQIRLRKDFDSENEPDWNGEVAASVLEPLDKLFKKELEKVNGHCLLLNDEDSIQKELASFFSAHHVKNIACFSEELLPYLPKNTVRGQVQTADASITKCESLIARTGSALVTSQVAKSRQIQIFPPVHVVVGKESQLVPYLGDAIQALEKKYKGDFPSQMSLITGPSRTADIEKTLVLGAHGPKELLVIIVKNK